MAVTVGRKTVGHTGQEKESSLPVPWKGTGNLFRPARIAGVQQGDFSRLPGREYDTISLAKI